MADIRPDLIVFNGSDVDLVARRSDYLKIDDWLIPRASALSEQYVNFTRDTFDTMARSVTGTILYLPSENSVPHYLSENNDPLFNFSNKAFLRRAGNRYYTQKVGGCFFICLDSEEHEEARGRISGQQLDFLATAVEQAKEFKHVFCFIHLSAWRGDCKKDSQWFETVHPLLKEAGVSHVFGSCLHTYQWQEYDGIQYITTGSCGNNVEPPFSHFLNVTVSGDGVVVKVYWLGFPLAFPMHMQLAPPPLAAFIEEDEELIKSKYCSFPTEEENAAYEKAIAYLKTGDYGKAQEIWSTLSYFPCVQPEKVAASIIPPGGFEGWILSDEPEFRETLKKKNFKSWRDSGAE